MFMVAADRRGIAMKEQHPGPAVLEWHRPRELPCAVGPRQIDLLISERWVRAADERAGAEDDPRLVRDEPDGRAAVREHGERHERQQNPAKAHRET